MSKSIEKFSYNDIVFLESGIIAINDNKKNEIHLISHRIHIMGFRSQDTASIMMYCLDYGLVTHGKDEEEAKKRILQIVGHFLTKNNEKEINKILSSPKMEEYWGFYRLYTKKHTPKKIKNTHQDKKISVSVEDYNKMHNKLQEQENIITYLFSENQELKSEHKVKDENNVLFVSNIKNIYQPLLKLK